MGFTAYFSGKTLGAFLCAIVMLHATGAAIYGNILIPGSQTLSFKAGQTEQKVIFRNPQENSCNFKITLLLEGGQVIWTSELIPPGKTLTVIELVRKLERGVYPNSIVKYECFSVEDGMQLNGAQIRVKIHVK